MNIIFLDFDGVICTTKDRLIASDINHSPKPWDVLNKDNLLLLKHLQDKHDILYVVSSRAWKKETKEEQEQRFRDEGVELKLHDDFKTPSRVAVTREDVEKHFKFSDEDDYLSDFHVEKLSRQRGWEIKAWLDRQPNQDEINYLILDDSDDIFPLPIRNLIHVRDGEIAGGINVKHFDEIDKYFTNLSSK